jgi:hypothetical protein
MAAEAVGAGVPVAAAALLAELLLAMLADAE